MYIPTGIAEFDRLIGGGLVAGSTVLLGGYPGVGKTTLCVQIADSFARNIRQSVLIASGEQPAADFVNFAQRINCTSERVEVLTDHDLKIETVLARAHELRPTLIIVDTLQSITSNKSRGKKGSTAQTDAVAIELSDYCRQNKTSVIALSHMNSHGGIKATNSVLHRCDTILVLAYPSGDVQINDNTIKKLYVDKNRHGQSELVSYWRMTANGMVHVPVLDAPRPTPKYRKHEQEN